MKYEIGTLLEVTEDNVLSTTLKKDEVVKVVGFELGHYAVRSEGPNSLNAWIMWECYLRPLKKDKFKRIRFQVVFENLEAGFEDIMFSSENYNEAENFCEGKETLEIKKVWIPGVKNE